MKEIFRKFSQQTSEIVGSPGAFITALFLLLIWAFTGPVFHFSDTWQLVVNTATTIVTFLMVFLIQNTQNRDNRALHLKLDELIRSMKGARNKMVDLEELSDDELDQLQAQFRQIREKSNRTSIGVGEVVDIIREVQEENEEKSKEMTK